MLKVQNFAVALRTIRRRHTTFEFAVEISIWTRSADNIQLLNSNLSFKLSFTLDWLGHASVTPYQRSCMCTGSLPNILCWCTNMVSLTWLITRESEAQERSIEPILKIVFSKNWVSMLGRNFLAEYLLRVKINSWEPENWNLMMLLWLKIAHCSRFPGSHDERFNYVDAIFFSNALRFWVDGA